MSDANPGAKAPPAKSLPALSPLNRQFWEGAARDRLMLQKCGACGHVRFPLGPVCTHCLSPETEWAEMSGRGTVLSHLVFHQVYSAAWRNDVPYSVVMVELDEGARLFSNIVTHDGSDIESDLVGSRVEAVFDTLSDEIGLLKFKPAAT